MYFRQLLRAQFVRTGAAHLNRLQRVCRVEVPALKINLIVINMLLSLTAAEEFDNNCPTSPGGGCGKPAVPHHGEVWFTVPPQTF